MTGRFLIFGAAILPALSAAAMDQPKYDLKLEKAAMDIVAAKMGNIRPGFAYGQRPAFVVPQEPPLSLEERAASWRILTSDPEPRAASSRGSQDFPTTPSR